MDTYWERKRKKEKERRKRLWLKRAKKLTKLILIFAIVFFGYGTINKIIKLIPKYPPTGIAGHVEIWPNNRILNSPLAESIQKHLLEHTPYQDLPGVIIHYNCRKFVCEKDLIANLRSIVEKYPYVYLAPGDYDGKIILTKSGERLILSQFSLEVIENFIQSN